MPKFYSVSFHLQLFSRYKIVKNQKYRNAPNDLKMNLNTKQSQVPCIHYVLTPKAQMLVPFTLRLAVFDIQSYLKSEISKMHRMTSK